MTSKLPRYLVAALLVAFTTQGFAQFGGSGGGMGGMGGGGRSRARGGDVPVERATVVPADLATAAALLRDHLLDIRLQLLITPEQSAAWSKFSDAVWSLAGHRGIRPAPPEEGASVVRAMSLRAAQAQERASQLQALATALDRLYAVLTPEQQRLADQQLAGAFP